MFSQFFHGLQLLFLQIGYVLHDVVLPKLFMAGLNGMNRVLVAYVAIAPISFRVFEVFGICV